MAKGRLYIIFHNKVLMYMLTRYATYALAFIVSLYVAAKMGPRYYGMWGFFVLVFSYFNLINFGVPQAIQVLLVQHKDNKQLCADYEKTGLYLMGAISSLCFLAIVYYFSGGFSIVHDNGVGILLIAMCICGIFNYYNLFYSKIYRTRNRVFELSFQQSSVVVLMFLCVLFLEGKWLLYGLVLSYFVATLCSMLLFFFRGAADFSGTASKSYAKITINKGLYLFLYNSGFYFIVVSTKTLISKSFTLEEFGYFTFAYMLGNAVFQLVDAFAYLVSAKLLDRYRSTDLNVVLATIRLIRINFVSLFHGIIYMAMIFFPLLLYFIPKYENTLWLIFLCCLTMLLYTNSFGYSTLLVARNKEKKLAVIAISSLLLNIFLGVIFIHVLKVSYEFVILSTMITYVYYAWMCVLWGRGELNMPRHFVQLLSDAFPVGLLIPFLSAIVLIVFKDVRFVFVPFLLFLLLNVKVIKDIYGSFLKILYNPNSIDV